MANQASLFQLPEAPQSASTVTHRFLDIEEDGAQLLELRTENGAVYLRPSRWQRIRLQWTFRHFHVLSPHVLSRADRRLIEKLSQSAVVTPALPVASNAVIGVVEKVRSKPPASANPVVTLRSGPVATQVFLGKPKTTGLPGPDLSMVSKQAGTKAPGGRKATDVRGFPFQQWRELGALAAAGLVLILASVYRAPLIPGAVQLWRPRTPIEHAANDIKPPVRHPVATSPLLFSPATALLPYERGKPWMRSTPGPTSPEPTPAPRAPATVAEGLSQSISAGSASSSPISAPDSVPEPAPAVSSVAPARTFVAELPQGYFAHPFVSDSNLVGELQLKALIGADGSVKEVTVLSGNPRLAEAGVRAVRKWHYSPYQMLGRPVEVETEIKMNFFGQDAVSIASVAPTSQPK